MCRWLVVKFTFAIYSELCAVLVWALDDQHNALPGILLVVGGAYILFIWPHRPVWGNYGQPRPNSPPLASNKGTTEPETKEADLSA